MSQPKRWDFWCPPTRTPSDRYEKAGTLQRLRVPAGFHKGENRVLDAGERKWIHYPCVGHDPVVVSESLPSLAQAPAVRPQKPCWRLCYSRYYVALLMSALVYACISYIVKGRISHCYATKAHHLRNDKRSLFVRFSLCKSCRALSLALLDWWEILKFGPFLHSHAPSVPTYEYPQHHSCIIGCLLVRYMLVSEHDVCVFQH